MIGEQHFRYNEFFHGSVENYVAAAKRDVKKEQWISKHGIKLVRLSGDCTNMDETKLRSTINSIEYPSTPYAGISFCEEKPDILKTAREYRKQLYQDLKRKHK